MDYFTSDWHLYHKKIIEYSGRKFRDTAEMNGTIIRNINEVVQPNDWLHFLGDLAFVRAKDTHYVAYLLDQINCRNMTWILGNHDKLTRPYAYRFQWINEVNTVTVGEQKIFLSHYAHRVWNKSHRGTWHLYGHSHGSLPDDPNSLSFDVGVDCHDFKPLSFNQVAAIMAKKTFKPKDHHGTREWEINGSIRTN